MRSVFNKKKKNNFRNQIIFRDFIFIAFDSVQFNPELVIISSGYDAAIGCFEVIA
jgi:hypothetical protein